MIKVYCVLRVMCTHFTFWCAHISQFDVHIFHILMCTHFTFWCAHISQFDVHTFQFDVHTFHSLMCTHFTFWCAHISHFEVHTFHSVMCTLCTFWCAQISQCDVHTFHSVMCTHFTFWCAHISQCDVQTFHTAGGFLIVRYWHSSAAVKHTNALVCGKQMCWRTTWLRYDVQYNTASMFVKLDIRGFIPSYSPIIMSLIWSVMFGSDESDWDHVDCVAVPPMSPYFAIPCQLCQVSLPVVVLCRKGISGCCFVLRSLYFLKIHV